MPAVPLPPYAPDVASVDAASSAVALNVFARADGYMPVPAPVPISAPLPDDCRGYVAVVSPLHRVWSYFAGTRTRLYRFNTTSQGWDDVTGPRAGGLPEGDRWQFAVYGSLVLAVHLGVPPQAMDIDRERSFHDLAGGPPRARAVGVVNEFVVLAGLASDPAAIHWSDLGDPTFWQPGLGTAGHTSDAQRFPDGGAVTGFAGGEFGVVFQERAIRRLSYSPGSPTVFDTSIVEESRGCVAPWAIVKAGPRTFFVDRDGFYQFTGGVSAPIGAERVNRTFLGAVDANAIASTIAVRDTAGPRVLFCYRTPAADSARPALLDGALVYDYQLDRWTALSVPVLAGMATATPPVSLDAYTGNADAMTGTWDDPTLLGGVPALGFVTPDRRMSLMTGAPLEATIETADAMLMRPNRAFARSVRLDSDAEDWRVSVGVRESLQRSVAPSWKPETGPTVERRAPCRASGRYHRVRARIPGGTAWSYAAAAEVDATAEGMR